MRRKVWQLGKRCRTRKPPRNARRWQSSDARIRRRTPEHCFTRPRKTRGRLRGRSPDLDRHASSLWLDGGAGQGDDRPRPCPEREDRAIIPPIPDEHGGINRHGAALPRGARQEPEPKDPGTRLLLPGALPRKPGVLRPAGQDVRSGGTGKLGVADTEGKLGP